MKLELGNTFTHVVGAYRDEVQWLIDYLTFRDGANAFVRRRGMKKAKRIDPPKVRLYSIMEDTFPAGLTPFLVKRAREEGFTVEIVDKRPPPPPEDVNADLGWLRPYQLDAVLAASERLRGMVHSPTGCHAAGQGILMADGSTKLVEDVQVGDSLMGPDGPRGVHKLVRGSGPLVRIIPKRAGNPWTVNWEHVLTLVSTATGQQYQSERGGKIVDVSVQGWFSWSKWRRHIHKLFHVPVSFTGGEDLLVDPYFLGVLLGDGSMYDTPRVTTEDDEILEVVYEEAERRGLDVYCDIRDDRCPTYHITGKKGRENPLTADLRRIGVWGCKVDSKFVPQKYKVASDEDRLALLAGLTDTDGSLANGYYEVSSVSEQLVRDAAFIARSLGFAASVQRKVGWRLTYWGDIDRVGCVIPRKQSGPRAINKDPLRTGFDVEPATVDDFYGFTLDGDGRYLLDDFTVTHNSGKTEMMVGLTRRRPCRWMFLVHRSSIAHQTAERYNLRAEEAGLSSRAVLFKDCGGVAGDMTVSTFHALRSRIGTKELDAFAGQVEGMIVDEAHTLPASSFYQVAMSFTSARLRLGFSGTPLARDDKRSLMAVGVLGPVIYSIPAEELIEKGYLSRPIITMVYCEQDVEKPTYQGVYGEAVVRSSERNRLLAKITKAATKPTILFVKELKHGLQVVKHIQRLGLSVRFVWGDTKQREREQAVKDLERGDLDVVVASVVWQEGIDIPSLESVIVGCSGKSAIAALQRIGRGMRPATTGKSPFEVWDVYDAGNPMLERHSRARKKTYQREGYEVLVFNPDNPNQLHLVERIWSVDGG